MLKKIIAGLTALLALPALLLLSAQPASAAETGSYCQRPNFQDYPQETQARWCVKVWYSQDGLNKVRIDRIRFYKDGGADFKKLVGGFVVRSQHDNNVYWQTPEFTMIKGPDGDWDDKNFYPGVTVPAPAEVVGVFQMHKGDNVANIWLSQHYLGQRLG